MNSPVNEIGFLGVETPASIKRKVLDLTNSWSALAKSFPNNELIKSEFAAYQIWANDVNSSIWNRIFASGIAPKYNSWVERYKSAYQKAQKESPEVKPVAPEPETLITFDPETKTSPWIWAIVAASGALGLYSIYKLKQ